ncbi:MAG: bifunctional [glutamate--ammonia ligase]-adenylyl-L-tyrosine phosphorylase/[glutamate--ammonia-ligase] adenylyltransferase [Gammaproteobacteria bacterium]|nr:bifunctional [glutamate--ammonia ligase]-adenylyl-L-tyrosine phosphorylase/[glutamate--ammonia-ligase] adenylyltransferase [Gammaproteobacteria bacterium]
MTSSPNQAVQDAVAKLPQELRASALRWFERCGESHDVGDIHADVIAPLTRVIAASNFAASTTLQEWLWLVDRQRQLAAPPDTRELAAFARQIAASNEPVETVKEQLRRFRNRYLLHVLWREIEEEASLEGTLIALSDLADRLLEAAAGYAERQMHERFGIVRDDAGERVPLVILGMGKLGGRELNFSSDIDLIFVFPGGDASDGARSLSAVEYFTRMARQIVALLDEVTGNGFVFRIDTRLRPFGDSGPPVVSFAALESYLTQHGRGWERYAYVKARIVGPQPPAAARRELYQDLIVPFVYRRYLDFGVFASLRDMHALIAAEVRRRELADNIKLGPGGIREIEFIVQSLQLVRGGSRTDLQERRLQTVLPRLVGHQGLSESAAATLLDAYAYLRRLENFIQALHDQQVHELPRDELDRRRLCLAMRYASWEELCDELQAHRSNVTAQFEKVAFRQRDETVDDRFRGRLTELWDEGAAVADWTTALAAAQFVDAEEIARAIAEFAATRSTRQIDTISRQRLRQFIPDLLLLLKDSEQPLPALERTLAIVEKVLRRSAYLALLNENTLTLHRLVALCERSAYIAAQIATYPILLDELLDPRIYTARITRAQLDAELQQRAAHCAVDDSEAQMEMLGQFQRASRFRIAVADYNGSLPIMRVSDSLTDLAETVLNHALRVAWQDMTARYGVPQYTADGTTRRAGFGIIAYGKLGGIELSYQSDLDLVFLHDSRGDRQLSDGAKPLDNSVFFTRLVRRLMHFLTAQTGSGVLYEIDMRLRPDGKSGLLVTSVDAFERYQEDNAWTWEHQALLRARPVAGSAIIAREFERIRADTLIDRVHRDTLRDDVVSMRQRMRRELDKSNAQQFDLKQGSGGIGDIEFIVQYLVLASAGKHRSVIHYPDNIRQLATLAAAGCLRADWALGLQDIYRAYRIRLHHLALENQPPIVASSDFVAEREYVIRVWHEHLQS